MTSATSCIVRGRIDDFLDVALEPRRGLRKGQAFMNELHRESPVLYAALSGSPEDPFYDDSRLWAAVAWVRDNWGLEHK